VREIDIPFMRRYIGTLREVTEVAKVAMVHDLPVVLLGNTVHLHGVGLIHKVEQGRKGVAEADTASAAMTDVVDAFQFTEKLILVIERCIFPVQRMPGRSF
jgi:hypothetical protein